MKQSIISGNFLIEVDGEFDESATIGEGKEARSVAEIRDEVAVASLVHREGLSAVYKALIPKDATGEAAKRNNVAFTEDAAEKMVDKLVATLEPYGGFTVNVTQHVAGEKEQATTKEAQAVVDAAKERGSLAKLAKQVGVDVADEKAIVIAVAAKLREARAKAAAAAKAALEV